MMKKYIDYHYKNDSNPSQCLAHIKFSVFILLNELINAEETVLTMARYYENSMRSVTVGHY